MLENLSTLQIVLLGAAGVAVYFFWLAPSGSAEKSSFDPAKLFACLKAKLLSAKKVVEDKVEDVKKSDKPTTVEVVQKFEEFRNRLVAAGLVDAVAELDEIWALMNPNPQKDKL